MNMLHKQISTNTVCQSVTPHKLQKKNADYSMSTQPKFGFLQHGLTYLMTREGKESSAKV